MSLVVVVLVVAVVLLMQDDGGSADCGPRPTRATFVDNIVFDHARQATNAPPRNPATGRFVRRTGGEK